MELEDEPNRVAPELGQPLIIKIKDVEVPEMNCPASGSVQSTQNVKQGTFSRPRLSNNSNNFGRGYGQIDTLENLKGAIDGEIRLGDLNCCYNNVVCSTGLTSRHFIHSP